MKMSIAVSQVKPHQQGPELITIPNIFPTGNRPNVPIPPQGGWCGAPTGGRGQRPFLFPLSLTSRHKSSLPIGLVNGNLRLFGLRGLDFDLRASTTEKPTKKFRVFDTLLSGCPFMGLFPVF